MCRTCVENFHQKRCSCGLFGPSLAFRVAVVGGWVGGGGECFRRTHVEKIFKNAGSLVFLAPVFKAQKMSYNPMHH